MGIFGPVMTRSISHARTSSDDEQDKYLPTVIAMMVLVVGAIGMLYAVVSFVGAVYFFVSGFISIAQVLGDTGVAFGGIVPFGIIAGSALIIVGLAWLQYYVARQVIEGARWAWWVTLILTAPTIPILLGMYLQVPPEITARLPWWWTWVALIPSVFVTITLLLAIFADVIVRFSISRHHRSTSPG